MEKQQVDLSKLDQICLQISNPFVKAAPTFISAAVPLAQTLLKMGENAYQLFWQAYQRAGCPYGESDEGLQEWLGRLFQNIK